MIQLAIRALRNTSDSKRVPQALPLRPRCAHILWERRFPQRMILRISLLLVFFSVTAGAQSKQDFTDAFHTGGNEFQFWGGYSPISPTWIGKTDARHLFMAGVGWRRVILASD